MDMEILEALKSANAIDEASGLTIKKLMDTTGKHRDNVVGAIRRLQQAEKVSVSSVTALNSRADHAHLEVTGRDATGADLAMARNALKDQTFFPITVWLGPEILKEIEDKRDRDRFIEELTRPSLNVGTNYGHIGDNKDSTVTSIIGDGQSRISATDIAKPHIETITTSNQKKTHWLQIIAWAVGILVGLVGLVSAFRGCGTV